MHDDVTPTISLIVVRVTVAAATVDELVGRCARWFRDGQVLFVPTEAVQPSGRRVRFVLALAGGQDAVVGEGVVLRMRRDSGDPRRPPGMELRYEIVDAASAALVERILAAKRTPPPYVSLRIDRGRADIEATLVATPLPPPRATSARLTALPRPPSPEAAARGWRMVGVGLATAAAVLAVALAMAMMRMPPDASAPAREHAVAVGGNGVVVAAPGPEPPRPAATAHPTARLRVTSTPPGAAVRLDGRDVGFTPLELEAAAFAVHHVRIALDGHVWRRRVHLRASGARVSVDEPGPIRVAHDLRQRVRP